MSSPKGKGSKPSNGESKSESVKKGNSSMCTNRSGSSGASQPMQIVSVSSEEINFLLYRYLQENGTYNKQLNIEIGFDNEMGAYR